MSRPGLVLIGVEHERQIVDVRTDGGRISSIEPSARGSVTPHGDEVILDGGGGALLPGLHDHHLHLMALAASLNSVAVGPPEVVDTGSLIHALRASAASLPAGAWLRAVGYHEGTAGPLDRWALDAAVADRPVRVQHRSGALWVLNSRALTEVGLVDRAGDGVHNGRLFSQDAWLAERMPRRMPDLADVSRMLAARGVTGVTDATPYGTTEQFEPIVAAMGAGTLAQRVVVTGAPDLDVATVALERSSRLSIGPAKLLLPDHDLPLPDEIAALVRLARAQRRAVAVHCVTRAALVVTLAALADVGTVPGDRLEHGSVIPPELRAEIRRLGLSVVTQPNLVAERGDDYLAEVDPADLAHLWPCRSLLAADIPVAAGTDAPFGGADPWRLIDAAVRRTTASGAIVGHDERIAPEQAVDLLLHPGTRAGGPRRRVSVGGPADLCLLDRSLADALASPAAVQVRATVIEGALVHSAG